MELADTANQLSAFLVGKLGNGTGIDDAKISLFAFLRLPDAIAGKLAPDSRGLRKIKFATQSKIGCSLVSEKIRVCHLTSVV
jgi:hypothetical protein